jgi:aryl-alcohol dehydrogenase-like predicted oxidoreductase
MALTGIYGQIHREDAIAVVHQALDLGIDHFDTAELYGPYTNEELLADALGCHAPAVRVATKFGYRIHNGKIAGVDSSPALIPRSVEGSLRRLRRDRIDLLYQHRPDPQIPIEDVVGTMAELVFEGKVAELGLCAVDSRTLQRARKIHPIAAVQNEYSLIERQSETEILPALRDEVTMLIAYSPLARGILAGNAIAAPDREVRDYRRSDSRFARDQLSNLRDRLRPLWEIAEEHGVSPAAVALAWLLSRSSQVWVIPGARTPTQMVTNVSAARLLLSERECRLLDLIGAS